MVATCSRFVFTPGEKVVDEVPDVIPRTKALRIAGFEVSLNGLGETGVAVFPVVFS
jgi:hypothetical protein